MKVNDNKWHKILVCIFTGHYLFIYVSSPFCSDLFNRLLALFNGNRALELLVWFKCMGDLEYKDVWMLIGIEYLALENWLVKL